MTCVARSLIVPLALAVGCSMGSSFVLRRSLVPVLAIWLLEGSAAATRASTQTHAWIDRVRDRAGRVTGRIAAWGVLVPVLYVVVTGGVTALAASTLGREIFPSGGGAEFQLRLRAPTGTKFEVTERLAVGVLDEI